MLFSVHFPHSQHIVLWKTALRKKCQYFFSVKPVANQDLLVKNKEWKRSDPSPISELPSQPVLGITKTPGHSYRVGLGNSRVSIFSLCATHCTRQHFLLCTILLRPPLDAMRFLKGALGWVALKILEIIKRFQIQPTAGQLESIQGWGGGFYSFFSTVSYLYTRQPLNPRR